MEHKQVRHTITKKCNWKICQLCPFVTASSMHNIMCSKQSSSTNTPPPIQKGWIWVPDLGARELKLCKFEAGEAKIAKFFFKWGVCELILSSFGWKIGMGTLRTVFAWNGTLVNYRTLEPRGVLNFHFGTDVRPKGHKGGGGL